MQLATQSRIAANLFLVFSVLLCGAKNTSGMVESPFQVKSEEKPNRKPNIVLINLDDCDVDLVSDAMLANYPKLQSLAQSSIRFTNCHVTTPLCGPSRACLFRSQYAHNTGYRTNRPSLDVGSGFTGGTQYFKEVGLADDQLPVWMNRAGYHTMLVGKYFQGDTKYSPVPGWDRFIAWRSNNYIDATSVEIAKDGNVTIEPHSGYRPEQETDDVVSLLDDYAKGQGAEKPFFLYFSPVAPHVGARNEDPIPQKWNDRFRNVQLPTVESFNEADLSDKPIAYQSRLPLSNRDIESLKSAQRKRLVSMLSIDEMIDRVRRKVEEIGQTDNTIIILTSDHGYLLGQHRVQGKSFPLIEATRVPLWVHWPNVSRPREVGSLLAHIDISATVADLGGATLPDFVDGRTFAKLLSDESIGNANAVRESVLVENWESRLNARTRQRIVYSSIIKANSIYTRWATGEAEFYNLNDDPLQLANGYSELSVLERNALEAELQSVRRNSSKRGQIVASICVPTINRKFIGADSVVEGYVESNSANEPITISIRRTDSEQYWNGSIWQTKFVSMPTSSPIGASLLREWSLTPRLKGVESGDVLTIALHGRELNEPAETIRIIDVVYDDQTPVVNVSRPRDQYLYRTFAKFGGSIEDDQASGDVRLFVFNIDTEKYFDGQRWSAEKQSISVLLNTRVGLWHAEYPLPDGRYEITAIGQDAAGNWSEISDSHRCVVDSDSPKSRPLKYMIK